MQQRPSWEAKRSLTSQEIPAFYGIWRFITALTRARHLSLSWARSIQSIPLFHFSKIRFNIIFSSTPGSSKWLPSLRFPHQNRVCISSLLHTCYVPNPSHSSWLNHTNDICWVVQGSLHSAVTSSLLGPNILLSTLFSKTLSLHSLLCERPSSTFI